MLEEMSRSPVAERPLPKRGHEDLPRRAGGSKWPGLLLVAPVGIVATGIGHLLPTVGPAVVAIVIGIIISALRPLPASLRPGLRFAGRSVLQASIVLLGTTLSLSEVAKNGARSLPVLIGTLVAALVSAQLIGRALSVKRDLRLLVGVGTAICGASAIAATDAVISASEADVSYAVSTIFTFNVVAVLAFPPLGHLVGLSPHAFGLWSGTAINDVSSVVAASTTYGHGAASYAIVVKLTRTLAIIPISIAVGLLRVRRGGGAVEATSNRLPPGRFRRVLPLFILWFLAAVALNTAGLVPSTWHTPLASTTQVMITFALAAIGLSTQTRTIRRTGASPLLLGALVWLVVLMTSLGLQVATGTL